MTYQMITIVGNVGKDAELRYLSDGTAVTDFTVAVSKITGRGETRKEKTTWFKVTIWRDRAETAAQLIRKGAKILIAGEVDASAYTDKTTNQPRASLEITANTFQLLSPKADAQGGDVSEGDGGYGAPATAPTGRGNPQRGGGNNNNGGGSYRGGGGGSRPPADNEDDIPF